jgi:hypothetical protein
MGDATKRIRKWDAKYDSTRLKNDIDKMRPDMLASVTFVFPLLDAMEQQVKQTLDAKGVSIIQYPFYLNFGREMWHLRRINLSGESLAKEAATLIGKWVSRGLTQAVLEAIRSQVFDVGAPLPTP